MAPSLFFINLAIVVSCMIVLAIIICACQWQQGNPRSGKSVAYNGNHGEHDEIAGGSRKNNVELVAAGDQKQDVELGLAAGVGDGLANDSITNDCGSNRSQQGNPRPGKSVIYNDNLGEHDGIAGGGRKNDVELGLAAGSRKQDVELGLAAGVGDGLGSDSGSNRRQQWNPRPGKSVVYYGDHGEHDGIAGGGRKKNVEHGSAYKLGDGLTYYSYTYNCGGHGAGCGSFGGSGGGGYGGHGGGHDGGHGAGCGSSGGCGGGGCGGGC